MASRAQAESSSSSGSESKRNKSSSKNDSKDILTPSDISKSMEGETVKIKGELEYRKEASDNKFYRLSGGNGCHRALRPQHP